MHVLQGKILADWLIGYYKIMINEEIVLSLIKYRLIRIRKIAKNRIFLIFKYILLLYIRFKIKCGWY
jgi:hypothetical protein